MEGKGEEGREATKGNFLFGGGRVERGAGFNNVSRCCRL